MIDDFSLSGPHGFLSNFSAWPRQITAEHAYQAMKAANPLEAIRVLGADTPGQAKRAGRLVALRDDWERIKVPVMLEVVRAKFKDPGLRERLLRTGDEQLVEGNTWHDRTWGCVRGPGGEWVGENLLGKILMRVRDEVRRGG